MTKPNGFEGGCTGTSRKLPSLVAIGEGQQKQASDSWKFLINNRHTSGEYSIQSLSFWIEAKRFFGRND